VNSFTGISDFVPLIVFAVVFFVGPVIFDRCRTESEASVRSRGRAVRLPEAVKDEGQDLRHHDFDVRVDALQVYLNAGDESRS
jgi:hypothetical protein